MKKILILIILISGFAQNASACSVCFKGDAGQPANVALRAGVLLLLGVVMSVLGLFAWYFVQVAKRSKQLT